MSTSQQDHKSTNMESVYESQQDNKSTGQQVDETTGPQAHKSTSPQTRGPRNSVTRGLVDPSARGIENLFIWKESRVLVNAIYRMIITCKDYGFRDQIQRAAVSIMN